MTFALIIKLKIKFAIATMIAGPFWVAVQTVNNSSEITQELNCYSSKFFIFFQSLIDEFIEGS